MAEIKPIHFSLKGVTPINSAEIAEAASMNAQFAAFAEAVLDNHPPTGLVESINAVTAFLDAASLLDGAYGQDGALPVDDAAGAADEALRAVLDLQAQISRLAPAGRQPALSSSLDAIAIGIGLWCMRHQLNILAPAPVVNALARRANEAASRQETAATYALMQGFVIHLAPTLKSDLERSNPERPWRMLNVNFAITAIRTGDAAMMRYAFDCLNTALPDERSGFYAEACAIATQPGFPVEIRSLIEQEQRQSIKMH